MSESVELVLDARAELGEGAIWDGKRQTLLWVDIDLETCRSINGTI